MSLRSFQIPGLAPDADSRGRIWLIAVLLTIAAAWPRLHGLGELGFYGDEETTAMPALALLHGEGAVMPSGMPYHRALPLTWLNALSAKYFGEEKEFSYRLPAALFGILTIPLLFLGARAFVGTPVAALAALLLAFSEWHIMTSREARMYAPFLFFYLATAFSALRWTHSARLRDLLLAIALYAITLSLHTLGMLAAIFFLLPAAFAGWSRLPAGRLLLIFAAAVAWARFYSEDFVMSAFRQWKAQLGPLPEAVTPLSPATPSASWLERLSIAQPALAIAGAAVGIAVGLWLAHRGRVSDHQPGAWLRQTAHYGSAGAAGLLAATGNLHGAMLASLIFLILHPDDGKTIYQRTKPALWVLVGLAALWLPLSIRAQGVTGGIKSLLMFPFPYDLFMMQMYPGVFLLFVAMCLLLALHPRKGDHITLRALSLVCLSTLLAMGVVSAWGGLRYLIEIYPFMLLLAAAFLLMLLGEAMPRRQGRRGLVAVALLVIASGLLGGHGLPQSLRALNLKYGEDADYQILTYPYYPDHQAPGRFVKARLQPGDVVVAEDPLQQWWYVRRVDYWLRNPDNHRAFLHRGGDGLMRDNYVASAVLTPELLTRLGQRGTGRVWVITSGETAFKRDYYLSAAQRAWLETLEKTQSPRFTGRDGVTQVYCLGCPP